MTELELKVHALHSARDMPGDLVENAKKVHDWLKASAAPAAATKLRAAAMVQSGGTTCRLEGYCTPGTVLYAID
jgi:hypothetical protein